MTVEKYQTLMNDLDESDRHKINTLLQNISKGHWTESILEEGRTNHIVLYKNGDRKVVARVYGRNTSTFINREKELKNLKTLSEYSLAPRVEASWENGYILNYIEGRTLEHKELKKYHKLIARKMKRLHSIEQYGTPILFDTLISWYWRAHVNHKTILMENNILDLINIGQKRSKGCKVVFCHNDLLASNILIKSEAATVSDGHLSCSRNKTKHRGNKIEDASVTTINVPSFLAENMEPITILEGDLNQDKIARNMLVGEDFIQEELEFIDFEYSGLNYASFDIANHIREHIGYSLDVKKFPDDIFIKKFLKEYFSDIVDVNQSIIEDALREVKFFLPLSDCMWFLWALLKSDTAETNKGEGEKHKLDNHYNLKKHSSVESNLKESSCFDYNEYALFRLSLIPTDLSGWYPDITCVKD